MSYLRLPLSYLYAYIYYSCRPVYISVCVSVCLPLRLLCLQPRGEVHDDVAIALHPPVRAPPLQRGGLGRVQPHVDHPHVSPGPRDVPQQLIDQSVIMSLSLLYHYIVV